MQRRGRNWLLILAVGLVMWYVLSRIHINIVVPLSVGTLLLLIIGGIIGVYAFLKVVVGSKP